MPNQDLTARDREFPGDSRSNPLGDARFGVAATAAYVGFAEEGCNANRARPASSLWALLVPIGLVVAVVALRLFGVIG